MHFPCHEFHSNICGSPCIRIDCTCRPLDTQELASSPHVLFIGARRTGQHTSREEALCYHRLVAKRGIVDLSQEFLRHVLPAAIRPARTLWHELIGFLFLALAVWPIPSAVRTVRNFDGETGSLMRLGMIFVFVVVMGGYGISSFMRARRISRS